MRTLLGTSVCSDGTTSVDRDTVRREVGDFVAANWDLDLTVAEWWARLAASGWAAPEFPEEHGGRGLARELAQVGRDELRQSGVVAAPGAMGIMLAAPTILAYGTAEQIARFVPPILDGRACWCQLFSEPDAGSDLAGLTTRAERDGNGWLIHGRKVWTTFGQYADWGMLLARTNPGRPKRDGITWFALPMDQPGVEVRPLREMTGEALFSEVVFDGARVDEDCVIGQVDAGWAVARTTLGFERASLGGQDRQDVGEAIPGTKAGHLGARVRERLAAERVSKAAVLPTSELLIELAGMLPSDRTTSVRRAALIDIWIQMKVTALMVERAAWDQQLSFVAGNLAKLAGAGTTQATASVATAVLGPYGALLESSAPMQGRIAQLATFAPAVSIYGGTDQIQRNIVAERVLGLPPEPGPPSDTPFSELQRNGVQRGCC